MKIPFSLIQNLIEISLNASQLGDLLTMLGFELEDIGGSPEDPILDIKVVANRGDGLSALGLCREILAKEPQTLPKQDYQNLSKQFNQLISSPYSLEINSPHCTRYSYLILENLINTPSPYHAQKTLEQAGLRPMGLLVDLTNYILLELGHPLHAFDLDKFHSQKISVREAYQNERLHLLNDQQITLQTHHMVICENNLPIALAGIMGGSSSQISDKTTRILLEAAHFSPSSIRKTRKELGLNTEASYRFERWVDPLSTLNALQRFVDLYKEWTGMPLNIIGFDDRYPSPKNITPVTLRFSRLHQLTGINIPKEKTTYYLQKLGFQLEVQDSLLKATPPSWRQDILREEDLIEEVIRLYGYEAIIEQTPQITMSQGGILKIYQQIENIRQTLLKSGFDQIISHTLCGARSLDQLSVNSIFLRTPHSPNAEKLRSSLFPGLCEAYQKSPKKLNIFLKLVKCFFKIEESYREYRSLAILTTGTLENPNWLQKTYSQANFFTLKGTLEYLSKILRIPFEIQENSKADPRFHSTRQAEIRIKQKKIGILGQIHPDIAIKEKIPKETFLAELDIDTILSETPLEINSNIISRNPSITRDIALLVPKSLSYKILENKILQSATEDLESMSLFDLYKGNELPKGHYSLAINLVFRRHGKNLTDEEANNLRDQILKDLQSLKVTLRTI